MTGDDRFVQTSINERPGRASHAIYIDGIHRIDASVERFSDGTSYPTGLEVCYHLMPA